MNIVIWMLAGSIVGWIGYSFLDYNEQRGLKVSIMIGIAGGFIGGKLVAPMFLAPATIPGDFSMSALFFAAGVAAGFLFIGEQLHKRWSV